MKRHDHEGHVKWTVSAMRSFCHIIPEKWFVLFWMCDFIALTRCCKLVSFIFYICCFISKFNKAYDMPNILSVSWTTTRPFSGKFLPHPLGFPKTKLRTKFEIPSSSIFEDMFYRMPKIVGVTWPKPCPFWGKLFMHPVGIPCAKLRTKFELYSSNSFEDILDRLPKSLGVTWFKPCPFWGNYLCTRSAFPRQSYVPNLKSVS